MRGRDWLAACAAAAMIACASNPDPRASERTIERAQRDGHGGWIVITVATGEPIAGELIAVDRDAVRVLAYHLLVSVPKARIRAATLWGWETESSRLAALGILGTVSTISHGYFLIFSAPIWLLTSTITASVESRASQVEYPRDGWAKLAVWARCPQGMPVGLAPGALVDQVRRPPAPVAPAPSAPDPAASDPTPPVPGPPPSSPAPEGPPAEPRSPSVPE